jgi:chitinase
LSVGGWAEGSTPFSNVAADADKKANMADSTLWYLQTYNFDGVDIDWEYPGKRGGTPDDQVKACSHTKHKSRNDF